MGKVTIVGGGISGLAAGIYALLSGFECDLYERHTITGGQCTAWKRKGYHIDNCVHWMTGTLPGKEVHKVWRDVGAITNDVEIIQHKSFMQVEQDGKTLNVWNDLKKLQADMIAISPEDKKEIRHFIKMLKAFCRMEVPAIKPPEQQKFMDKMRLLAKIFPVIPHAAKYNKVPLTEYVKLFKSDIIRTMILSYLPSDFNTIGIVYMYSTFISGNGAVPRGGSLGIAKRMEERFVSLGGKIHTGYEATKIDIENGKAKSVHFKNGETVDCENIIVATDTEVTFKLVGENYMDNYFASRYSMPEKHPVFSNFNVYVGVDDPCEGMANMSIFKCNKPIDVFGNKYDKIVVNNYSYEPSYSPEGKNLLQLMILQTKNEFAEWEKLHNDTNAYRAKKESIANDIVAQVEEHYPNLKGKLTVVEIVTPYSFHRFCGAHKGAYMSFITTSETPREPHCGRISGIDNLYMAGQWIIPPGGLPNAVVAGKFAVQRLCFDTGTKFIEP